MSKISLVAAIDEQNGLGINNQLLCHLPADLNYFKQLTLSKPILMGRNTFDSIGKALPGRQNIVLTRQRLSIKDIEVVHSLSEALTITDSANELMIIGGADIYRQTLPLADCIYLTRIHHRFDADTFFPRLDESAWHCEILGHHEADQKNAYDMTFYRYSKAKF